MERIVIGKKRTGMHGFIIFGHVHRFEEAVARLAEWVRDGRLPYSEDIMEGIEQAPGAIADDAMADPIELAELSMSI